MESELASTLVFGPILTKSTEESLEDFAPLVREAGLKPNRDGCAKGQDVRHLLILKSGFLSGSARAAESGRLGQESDRQRKLTRNVCCEIIGLSAYVSSGFGYNLVSRSIATIYLNS